MFDPVEHTTISPLKMFEAWTHWNAWTNEIRARCNVFWTFPNTPELPSQSCPERVSRYIQAFTDAVSLSDKDEAELAHAQDFVAIYAPSMHSIYVTPFDENVVRKAHQLAPMMYAFLTADTRSNSQARHDWAAHILDTSRRHLKTVPLLQLMTELEQNRARHARNTQ